MVVKKASTRLLQFYLQLLNYHKLICFLDLKKFVILNKAKQYYIGTASEKPRAVKFTWGKWICEMSERFAVK